LKFKLAHGQGADTMTSRKYWSEGEIPALGLGCWVIGGPFYAGETPLGWGEVDDAQSIRAIHAGVDAGVRFFDTAQAYGAGHSEEVLGRAQAMGLLHISQRCAICCTAAAEAWCKACAVSAFGLRGIERLSTPPR
jgi:diketogulonate reductase-like aldo/keto reductase